MFDSFLYVIGLVGFIVFVMAIVINLGNYMFDTFEEKKRKKNMQV